MQLHFFYLGGGDFKTSRSTHSNLTVKLQSTEIICKGITRTAELIECLHQAWEPRKLPAAT